MMAGAGAATLDHEVTLELEAVYNLATKSMEPGSLKTSWSRMVITDLDYLLLDFTCERNGFVSCLSHCYFGSCYQLNSY